MKAIKLFIATTCLFVAPTIYPAEQEKDLGAFQKLQKAVDTHPGDAAAHHDLARVLARLRKQGKVCEFNAYKSTIMEHLLKAVELDPKRLVRIRKDRDLVSMKDAFAYHQLMGRSVKKADDLRVMLEQVTWVGPPQGVFGSKNGMVFAPGGKITFWSLDTTQNVVKKDEVPGVFKIAETVIIIEFSNPIIGKKTFKAKLDETGKLDVPDLGEFTDKTSECSA